METWISRDLLEEVFARVSDTLALLQHATRQRDTNQMLACVHVLRELRDFVRPFGAGGEGEGER